MSLGHTLRKIAGLCPPGIRRLLRNAHLGVGRMAFDVQHPWYDLTAAAPQATDVTVLDLGAHRGEAAVFFARRLPAAQVVAFEPNPTPRAVLEARAAKISNLTVSDLAISDTPGTATFFVNANEQTSSLLENDADNQKHLAAAVEHQQQIEVTVTTLDQWVETCQPKGQILIKADIQGAEAAMLRGGPKTLPERVAAVLLEVSIGQLYEGEGDFFAVHEALTRDHGFALAQLYSGYRSDGRLLWTDALWINPRLNG